jgi:hypothetical protein
MRVAGIATSSEHSWTRGRPRLLLPRLPRRGGVAAPLRRDARSDRRPADAPRSTSTHVRLVVVGDLAEQIVASVRLHARKGTLRSMLPIEDLRKRYGFQISDS